MVNTSAHSVIMPSLKKIVAVAVLTMVGFFSAGRFAFAAALTSTNVQPSSLVAGFSGTVTATFTTATTIPADGKIKITFGANFNVGPANSGTCSTMDGTFATSVSGQTVTITRQGDGTVQTAAVESCTISGITNPRFSGSTGTYTIQTTDNANSELDIDAAVAADTISTSTISPASVVPATLVAGATGTTTVTFTTSNPIPNDGVIKVTFGSGFDVSGAASGTCSSQDGTFVTTVSGQVVTLTRQGDGTSEAPGAQTCTIGTIVNPAVSGSSGSYTIATFLTGGTTGIDINATVSPSTITTGTISSASVVPATLVAGATGTTTVTFTTSNPIPANGKVVVIFGTNFTVSGATSGTCSTQDGTFATAVIGQAVLITRQADGTSEPAGVQTCTIGGITNPQFSGSTGTYTVKTTNSSGTSIDLNDAVSLSTITAGALTSTNVAPSNTTTGTTVTVTVSFTTANAIPSTGKIKVTFGSGFSVASAASGTCSTMDGSFATSVSGQVVTITRSAGTSEPAGAQTCTIASIINPVTAGSTGTYTITTTDSSDVSIDTDAVVTADVMYGASSDNSGTSTGSSATYDITFTTPAASAAYSAGDAIAISWSTSAGTGTVGAVNLAYSTNGGSTFTTIVSGTANDGSYIWTAPSISAQSITIRGEATDLLTVLATATSNAFSIGTEVSGEETANPGEDVDTSAGSTTLLPTGTFMKGESWSTVYYIDGATRRPFLDSQTFFTYADSFDAVVDTADDYLSNFTIGAPMLPMAGTVLVKIESVSKVYALGENGELHWVTSESVATALYGSNWADYVIDVPVTAWSHFTIGSDISVASDWSVDSSLLQTRIELNSK